MAYFVLIFIILILIISWLYFVIDRSRSNIPGPFSIPILGTGYMFLSSGSSATALIKVAENLANTFGDVIGVYLFFQKYLIFVHPKYIEAIASSMDFITKGVSYYYLQPWLGQGLLTATGNRWKTHRKFLTPAFHFNILQNFLPVFCKNGRILTKKLEKLAEKPSTIDLFPIVALATLDNVTESIMGVSMNAQKDSESEYVKAIEDLSNIISTRMRNPIFGLDVVFNLLPHKRRQDQTLKILHGQSKKVIESRREELKKANINSLDASSDIGIKNRHAFLDLLLLAEVDGKKLDDETVREEVDTFMFEGHDTTASGIVFALFCLSKHPKIQETVLDEQRSIFGDDFERDPTYSELKQMKYLELVIKESLRLYPSVPFFQRLVIQDSNVAGLKLSKGTSVILNILHMQRRADIYEDPLEFRPERFRNMEGQNTFNWLAFSAGPRNCIGQKFAIMELKVILSQIVKKFNILPSGLEPELCTDLILRSTNGVHVKLVSRH